MRNAIAVVLMGALGASCASTGPRTKRGGAIGAGAGAVVGGIIGHKTGSTARGAIIGAAVGGAAGALIGREMDQRAERIAHELPNAKVSRVGEGIAVTFESGILFPFDSSELLPEARRNLQELADQLQEEARTEVMIVGHTDSLGTDSYNQDLSERRARSAASYLRGQGVESSRLQPLGRGEREPIESNTSEAGRQQNRRVEIAIYANRAWREDARRDSGDQ
ncbi:MAG TPA: OmpA family protein [Vicinamibacteria bacterium]|nr:OmpA family protein [Vicinamibacteria bacterium]